jgi:putative transposase
MGYVEANPVRAGLVPHAQDWPFSSLWPGPRLAENQVQLDQRLVLRPTNWTDSVNQSISPAELERLHVSVNRGRPFGTERWTRASATRLGLQSTLRSPGRPRMARPQGGKRAHNV